MSTSAVTPTPTDAEVEAYIRQLAAEEAAKLKGTSPTQNDPQPVVMNIGGKEMSFKDMNEAQAHINQTLGQYQQQVQQYQTQGQGRRVTDDTDAGPKFDQKHYVDLMVSDPLKAQDYVDEFRFGMKNPVEVLKQTLGAVQQLATQSVVNTFIDRHPEYDVNEQNANAIQSVMNEMNLPIAPAALEAAYAVAQKRGLLTVKENNTQQTTPAQEPNPYLAGPPVASRTNSSTAQGADPFADLEYMPMEQLEKLVQRFQGR